MQFCMKRPLILFLFLFIVILQTKLPLEQHIYQDIGFCQ